MEKWPNKTRAFVITNWNLDCDYQKLVDSKKLRYIAYGEEVCPTTGTKHHQAFCYFHNTRSTKKRALGEIGKMFGKKHANVQPMLGNFLENESYCSKDGIYTEVGKKPKQGERGDLNEIKDMIVDGQLTADDVALSDPHTFHMYGRTLDRLESIALRKKFRTEMTRGIWYTGPAGAGKSHAVFEGYSPETHYVKNLNEEWWDGYKGQETVILNEFRGEIRFSELLDLCDKWPKMVKWRGRESVPFLAKRVLVASVKSPREVYCRQEGEPWEQFDRRFDVIELEQKYSEGNNDTSDPFDI